MDINDKVFVLKHNKVAGETGKIVNVLLNEKAEVKLDCGIKIIVPLVDLEQLEEVNTIKEKPPIAIEIKELSPEQKLENRANYILQMAIDEPAIMAEQERLDKSIEQLKTKLEATLKARREWNKILPLACRRAKYIAKLRLTDAAAIVELANDPELKKYSRKM